MSQNQDIYEYMHANRINPLKALRLFGSMCLAQRIYDIENLGYLTPDEYIERQTVIVGKNKKRVTECWIERLE